MSFLCLSVLRHLTSTHNISDPSKRNGIKLSRLGLRGMYFGSLVHGNPYQDSRIEKIASEDRWQVCKGGCGNAPAMWFDGGIHANEWIGPAVATFMARWISFGTVSLFK